MESSESNHEIPQHTGSKMNEVGIAIARQKIAVESITRTVDRPAISRKHYNVRHPHILQVEELTQLTFYLRCLFDLQA